MQSFLPYGFLLSKFSFGGSVARARAPNVSMIKLIQSICTAEKMASLKTMAATKVVRTATTLTVN